MPTNPLTEEQKTETIYRLDKLLRKPFHGDREALGYALGYSGRSLINMVLRGKREPSVFLYDQTLRLWNEYSAAGTVTSVPAAAATAPAAVSQPKAAAAPRGTLAELDDIHSNLGKIVDRLHQLSESCVPLLRPGLLQYAEQLDRGRKVLEIA